MSKIETFDISSEELGRLKLWLWGVGMATMILGAIGIVFPFVVGLAAELLFGGLLATLGLLQIIRTAFNGGVDSRILGFLFGAICLAAGVLLLLYPPGGMVTLTIVLSSFFVVGGVIKLAGAWQMSRRRPRRDLPAMHSWGWVMMSGALSLVLGAILFLGLPSTATWALGLLLGVDLLFLGVSEIALAVGLSRFSAT